MDVKSSRLFAAPASSQSAADFGDPPEWNLADLYSGMEAPELKRDMEKAAADTLRFEARWKGTLAVEAARGAEGRLGDALKEYEALEELMGRIGSYAGLVYAEDTSDPQRAKLYGDVQEKMTDASAPLLFFALELNLVDDALIESALAADPAFGHYRPWVLDLRMDKPYQLDEVAGQGRLGDVHARTLEGPRQLLLVGEAASPQQLGHQDESSRTGH